MDWWVIGLILFGIAVIGRLFIASAQGNANAKIRENSAANSLIEAVEEVGKYDGSFESKRKAQSELDDEIMLTHIFDQQTEQLYWKTLEQGNLYILLALWYSIAVGHYLQGLPPQIVSNLRAGAKSKEAKDLALAMATFFPSYSNYVQQRHSNTDYVVILAISSNCMDSYIKRRYPELYSEMMYQ